MAEDTASRKTLMLTVKPDGTPVEIVDYAATFLQAGKLVAFPTETVYGLGADATNIAAVMDIFTAKGRPNSDPLIVHIPEADGLPQVAAMIPPVAWALAERFWPGPLTLVLPRSANIPSIVTANSTAVGVRVPNHPVARALLLAAGVPVAAPSANRFKYTSPTSAAHVLADLNGRIDCILDGGSCAIGVESTVLDLTKNPPRILRPGGITLEDLRTMLPEVQGPVQKVASEPTIEIETIDSPGQMALHYAPRTRLIVFDSQGEEALTAIRTEALVELAHGAKVGALLPDEEVTALAGLPVQIALLGSLSNLAEIAHHLYAALRTLDDGNLDLILAHTFSKEGLGLALWDRMYRAAGSQLRTIRT